MKNILIIPLFLTTFICLFSCTGTELPDYARRPAEGDSTLYFELQGQNTITWEWNDEWSRWFQEWDYTYMTFTTDSVFFTRGTVDGLTGKITTDTLAAFEYTFHSPDSFFVDKDRYVVSRDSKTTYYLERLEPVHNDIIVSYIISK